MQISFKKVFHAAAVLALHDIRKRYRRSTIGPWWITLSLIVQITLMGLVFSRLFGQSLRDYIPFLAIGIVLWNFLMSVVTDSIDMFTVNSNLMKQIKIDINFYILRTLIRNIIVFVHNLIVIVLLLILFRLHFGLNIIFSIFGLLMFIANLYWISIFVSVFATRFRDVGPIVLSLMQVFFYLTPIMWKARDFSESKFYFLIELNPVNSLFSIVRNHLIGLEVAASDYFIVLALLFWGTFFASKLLARVKDKIIFWI